MVYLLYFVCYYFVLVIILLQYMYGYAPNPAIHGDTAWTPSRIRRKVEMLRLWLRLQSMDEGRLTEYIFKWDRSLNRNNWCSEVKCILQDIDQERIYNNNCIVSLNLVWAQLYQQYVTSWGIELVNKPKLRTYVKCKSMYETEHYISSDIPFKYRSILARLRCGILPLELEIGRYHGIPESERVCKICKNGSIENEFHFLFQCAPYQNLRLAFFDNMQNKIEQFAAMDFDSKFKVMMDKSVVYDTSKYVYDIFMLRQSIIYK